ncbi:G-box-binding factor 1 [Raphanus sativus]|nr:G-box-binding factor 1 [Raphanus sativus]
MLRSDESVTAGSSDENANNHQEQGSARKLSFGQMLADGTNLNTGMDLWSFQAGVAVKMNRELKRQKKRTSITGLNRFTLVQRNASPLADKQVVFPNITQPPDEMLKTDESRLLPKEKKLFQSLRDELQRLSNECEKLKTENNPIQSEAVANVEQNAPAASKDDEGTSLIKPFTSAMFKLLYIH